MVRIREEQPQDIKAIREVNIRAFGQTQEADIVDKLRQNGDDLLSLVADVKILMHFMPISSFSRCPSINGYFPQSLG